MTVLLDDHHIMFREGLVELLTSRGAWKWSGRRPTTKGPWPAGCSPTRSSCRCRFTSWCSPKERPPLVDGSRSRAFDQAENRLHARKALLYPLLG